MLINTQGALIQSVTFCWPKVAGLSRAHCNTFIYFFSRRGHSFGLVPFSRRLFDALRGHFDRHRLLRTQKNSHLCGRSRIYHIGYVLWSSKSGSLFSSSHRSKSPPRKKSVCFSFFSSLEKNNFFPFPYLSLFLIEGEIVLSFYLQRNAW